MNLFLRGNVIIAKETKKQKVMDTKEETRQNIQPAEIMARAEQRKRKNESTRRMNKLWMWLGVLILVFILLFWIFGIGTQEAVDGVDNGVNTELTAPASNPDAPVSTATPATGD